MWSESRKGDQELESRAQSVVAGRRLRRNRGTWGGVCKICEPNGEKSTFWVTRKHRFSLKIVGNSRADAVPHKNPGNRLAGGTPTEHGARPEALRRNTKTGAPQDSEGPWAQYRYRFTCLIYIYITFILLVSCIFYKT